MRVIRFGVAAALCICTLSCSKAHDNPSTSAKSSQDKDLTSQDDDPRLPGILVTKGPVWVSVEGGVEGKVHVAVTSLQCAHLGGKYKALRIYPPQYNLLRAFWLEVSLLGNEKSASPKTLTVLKRDRGEPYQDVELCPITVLGVLPNDTEEEIAFVSPHKKPYWETLLSEPYEVRFSRYPHHVSAEMPATLGSWVEGKTPNAVFTLKMTEEQARSLAERFTALEIRASAVLDPVYYPVDSVGMGRAVSYTVGKPISEDAEVTLVSLAGVTREKKREFLWPAEKK